MRLRTLLALTVVLVVGTAGAAVAQTPGTAEVIFIHEAIGAGPVAVGISNPSDPDAGAHLGVVGELGDARTTLPAGPGYVLAVAPPDALDQPLAETEPFELVAGNRYVVLASGDDPDAIGFDIYLSDPIEGGNVRVEHRTGRTETLMVGLRNDAEYEESFDLRLGAVEDRVDLTNGRYTVAVSSADGQPLASVDDLEVEAGQWTVVTIVADGDGVALRVTGPGPLPNPSPAATPSASPRPVRTPNRIDTGAGGTATGGPPSAALVTLGLLTGAAALVALSGRWSPER